MNILSKFIAILLLGMASITHANVYLSLGGGVSNTGKSTTSDDTAYKIASGLEVVDDVRLQVHHANLGKTNNNIEYKYMALGGNYYFSNKTNLLMPFVGGGVAKYSTNSLINKEIQGYATAGATFAIVEEFDVEGSLSYTKYAKDAEALFFEVFHKF